MPADISLHQFLSLEADCTRSADVAPLLAGDHPGTFLVTEPSRTLDCRPPLWLGHSDAEQRFFFGGKAPAAFDLAYPFPASGVAVLPYARLVGRGYVVVAGDNRVVTDSFSGDQVLETDGRFHKRALPVDFDGRRLAVPFALQRCDGPTQRVPARCVLPTHFWHFNYHHWMVECLPRLRQALEWPALAHCPVIVPRAMAPFQRESLAMLGVDPERLLPFDEGDWRLDSLVFPTVGRFTPAELEWVRAGLLRAVETEGSQVEARGSQLGVERRASAQPGPPRSDPRSGRLYISRRDAAVRRLANEVEVERALAGLGFESLTLTGMPLAEQIDRFASAEIVVGPHGSGLTNMLFAPRSATIVELMPDDSVNHCFWLMANVLGQRYTFLGGSVVSAARDFVVPVERLMSVVGRCL